MSGVQRNSNMHITDYRNLRQASYELGRDGVLNDPTDTQLLTAAAELAELQAGQQSGAIDLDLLNEWERREIIDYYDRGTGL